MIEELMMRAHRQRIVERRDSLKKAKVDRASLNEPLKEPEKIPIKSRSSVKAERPAALLERRRRYDHVKNKLEEKGSLNTVRETLRRFAGGKNEHVIREVMQETAIKALENSEKFQPDTDFTAWLHKIAIRTFIDFYRRERRQQRFATKTFDETSKEMEDLNLDTGGAEDQAERSLKILEAIESMVADSELSEEEAEFFTKHTLEGKSHKELAEEYCVAEGTSMSRTHRATIKIKAYLKEYFPEVEL